MVGDNSTSGMFIGLGKLTAVSGSVPTSARIDCCLHHIVFTKVSASEKPPDPAESPGKENAGTTIGDVLTNVEVFTTRRMVETSVN